VRLHSIGCEPTANTASSHRLKDFKPSQSDIDSAYAVKVFLDHHPATSVSIPALAGQCGLPESQLKKAFLYQFNIRLEDYLTQLQAK
jgi:AraC-like DNA-binding protein